jgi:PAS domain S-box-containing protein
MGASDHPAGFASRAYSPVSGFFTWDIKQNKVYGNPTLTEYFGFKLEDATRGLPLEAFEEHMHPDDRQRVSRAIREAVEHRTPFRETYRVLSASGGTRHILAEGQCHYAESGEPLIFPGWFVDVTDGRNAEVVALRIAAHFCELASDAAMSVRHEVIVYLLDMVLAEIDQILGTSKLDGGAVH